MKNMVSVFLLVLVFLAAVCVLASARGSLLPLDASAQRMADDLHGLRLDAGLAAVRVDTALSHLSERLLSESMTELGMGLFDRPDRLELVGRCVADWEKHCFLVTAGSATGLVTALRATSGYLGAALDPLVSHVVVASGATPDGQVWGSACFVERLVRLGPAIGSVTYGGCASVTVQGTTAFPEVTLRAHRIDEDALGDEAESPSVVVYTDPSGGFSGTLRFPERGPARYDVIVLVRNGPGDEFRPAAKVGAFAPKPSERSGRAAVSPFEKE